MADPDATPTANYGWLKPAVGASVDVWGGDINADLDGIDSVVHGIQTSVPAASTTTPNMDGTAAVGTGTTWARADHVHPTDTSRASVAAVAALPLAMNDNRIINGDMRIDQRNNGASGTAVSYTADRWYFNATQAGKITWGRQGPTSSVTNPTGCAYYLGFTTAAAFTPAAGDTFTVAQRIEADMISDFAWGTPNAQSVTLSFWISTSAAGTYGGSLNNGSGATRSYPFSFSSPGGNVLTKIIITIPGDTTGTWVVGGNAAALWVNFDLGTGATYRAPAGAWAGGNYVGVNGAVSVVGTNAANFSITGVKLEIGSVATPFNRQSLAKSMADCQRYYWQGQYNSFGAGVNGGTLQVPLATRATMRAVPTATSNFTSSAGLTSPTVIPVSADLCVVSATMSGTSYTSSCAFTMSAEL